MMRLILFFAITLVFCIEISTCIKCYECSDDNPNYKCDLSHSLTGKCMHNYNFCFTAYHENSVCGNDAQKCVEKDCIGPEFCNKAGTFTMEYPSFSDLNGTFTIDCCEGDLCNSFDPPQGSGQSRVLLVYELFFVFFFCQSFLY